MHTFVTNVWLTWLLFLLPCRTVSFSCCKYVTMSRKRFSLCREQYVCHDLATTQWRRRTSFHPESFLWATSSAYSESSESSSPQSKAQQSASSVLSDQEDIAVAKAQQQTVRSEERPTRMELPWSDFQEWALRDHLPRYTVHIPGMDAPVALWRTMSREVTELNGYPVEFLRTMHARGIGRDNNNNLQPSRDSSEQQPRQENESTEALFASSTSGSATGATNAFTATFSNPVATPNVLPFLDEFEFQPTGGLCGRVYGLSGIADGTRITTTPVQNVQVTLPKGFVQTVNDDDASASGVRIAYELGRPVLADGVATTIPYSLDGTSTASNLARALFNKANEAATSNIPNGQILLDANNNNVLVQIGGLTTLVLGGALAMNLLSHHLTINVFWV